jgi:hypothetical protein
MGKLSAYFVNEPSRDFNLVYEIWDGDDLIAQVRREGTAFTTTFHNSPSGRPRVVDTAELIERLQYAVDELPVIDDEEQDGA